MDAGPEIVHCQFSRAERCGTVAFAQGEMGQRRGIFVCLRPVQGCLNSR